MENIPLPSKFESKKIDKNKSEVIIEPLFPGYGTTLGNVLRRILLSSLPGAAITAVKIKDVHHEFSTLPNVKEDIVDILLNLKQVNLKLEGAEEVKMHLNVTGEKKVTAGDFKKTAGVTVTNPENHIATLTDKSAKFEAELTVSKGRGYIPVEQREKEILEIGNIAIDSIYTPIRLVNFEVENVRVEQMTNFNRLRLIIETNGTITPEDALSQAAKILVDHFDLLLKGVSTDKKTKPVAKKDAKKEEKAEETKSEKPEKEEKEEKKKRGRPKKESK